jgi:nucleotide-binding universal stress UspA family protein
MLPLKTIVVVLASEQGHQPAWSQAVAWSQATGAALQVLVPVVPDVKPGLELSPGLQGMAAHNAETEAQHWWQTLQGEAPAGTGFAPVATTHPAEMILHEAQRFEADLLVIGADFLPDWRALLRHLPCPVLLARHDRPPRIMAAALGAGAEDSAHRLLNTAVVEHLQALAACFGAGMRVLSALPNPTELVPLMGDAYAASYAVADLESVYRESLEKQVTGLGLDKEVVKVSPGRPDVALPDLVRQESVDCLLLGTVARSGFAAFWLGNTAEDVLPRVTCDVLVLRPQDYMTPD